MDDMVDSRVFLVFGYGESAVSNFIFWGSLIIVNLAGFPLWIGRIVLGGVRWVPIFFIEMCGVSGERGESRGR
jgi:hypothetical protein